MDMLQETLRPSTEEHQKPIKSRETEQQTNESDYEDQPR